MGMRKCPRCKEWYYVPDYAVDYVHQCINDDGTRLTTKTKYKWIPGKINLDIFDKEYQSVGMNPPLPKRLLTKKQVEKAIHESEEVNTYIEFK